MNKLTPLLATLAALAAIISHTPTLATAKDIKYGWCFSNGDCTGDPIQVNGVDTSKTTNLMTPQFPHCNSFLGAADPPFEVYACEKGCNTDCSLAVNGQCTPITPGKPKGTRFQCAFRVTHPAEDA